MSQQDASSLIAEFRPQIETACREGRGEDLLKEFYRRNAAAYADTVFLRMCATLDGAASSTNVERLFEQLHELPHACGVALLEGVASTCAQFNLPREHQVAAERITAESYRTRLQQLLDESQAGGSA